MHWCSCVRTWSTWTWRKAILGRLGVGLVLGTVGWAPVLRGADLVIISEFVASNSGGLRDEDGDASDWLELFNAGTNTVNLGGWSLTDSAADLAKWTFPSTNLAPGAFLIVFASGKDR